jgi:hypothetical protein
LPEKREPEMLDGLTYKTYGMKSAEGYDFGHLEARIRSPYSSFESIWEVGTSHAAGGRKKHAALIHELAEAFIARAATADLRNDFAGCFEESLPALFLHFDGGEDRADAPTQVVVISPSHWRLMGSIENPWCVSYSGLVFDLDDVGMEARYHGGFWNDEWMQQVSMSDLEATMPDVAARVSERLPGVVFAEAAASPQHSI